MLEIFWIFLRLGLTSFGGPVAHLGFFHHEFVVRRKWVHAHAYADLVALCQLLPGPASSQVGMAIGMSRAGLAGAAVAWLGFTMPSALLLATFGFGVAKLHPGEGWLHGLKIAAVAVVAKAVWGMARRFCPDVPRAVVGLVSAVCALFSLHAWGQLLILLGAGWVGVLFLKGDQAMPEVPPLLPTRKRVAFAALMALIALLFLLPVVAQLTASAPITLFDRFFRAGALVFGGGHVVLPLLQAEFVPAGWVSNELFMAGYGAAQAMPGPLFSFSAFLGAVSPMAPTPWMGALIGLVAIFLPSFLMLLGILPFWEKLRRPPRVRRALQGVNAAVMGLLLAALYDPVWTSAIFDWGDFALAASCYALLATERVPVWAIVGASAVAGRLLT